MNDRYTIRLVACSPEQGPLAYPLGALCIQTALSHDPRISDRITVTLEHFLADTDSPLDAARLIADQTVDLVGISLYLYNRVWFDAFIDHLHHLRPDIRLCAGGPEATAHATTLLHRGFLFITLGEGEQSMCNAVTQLIAGQEPHGHGIQTIHTEHPTADHVSDLGSLVSPLLSGVAVIDSYEGILWEMTRGCPYHCAFCFESRGSRSVRTYPEQRIEKELDLLIRHEVKHLFILDPTFNMHRDRTVQMLTMLRDRVPEDMRITFEVRAELLDETTAQLFSTFHSSLQIGLQSSDATVLSGIGRPFNAQLFADRIALLNRFGVVFGLDLIIGLPRDTLQSFCKSLDFAIACKPSNIDIFVLAVLPGTQLALDAQSLHLSYLPESPYLLQESPTMSRTDIAEAIRLKEACDLFYTKGQAAMWFHAACDALQCTPSDFLMRFAEYLHTCEDTEDEDIYTIQDQFIREQFSEGELEHLLPAMLSYMELHQGIVFLQETDESPVVQLSYPPDDLATLDTVSIRQFTTVHGVQTTPMAYTIFSDGETLFVEPLI